MYFYNYYIILNGSNQDLKYGSHKVKITNKKYSREEIWVRMSSEGETVPMVHFRAGRERPMIDVFYHCSKSDLGSERSCTRLKFDTPYETAHWFPACSEKHKKDSFSGLLAACEIDPIPALSH